MAHQLSPLHFPKRGPLTNSRQSAAFMPLQRAIPQGEDKPGKRRNPFRVEKKPGAFTQGSSFVATLGFVAESLWDSKAVRRVVFSLIFLLLPLAASAATGDWDTFNTSIANEVYSTAI